MRQNPRLCKSPHKHSDLGLKSELTTERENAYVTVTELYWIRTSVLKGKRSNIDPVLKGKRSNIDPVLKGKRSNIDPVLKGKRSNIDPVLKGKRSNIRSC